MITINKPKYEVSRDDSHIYTIQPMGLVVPGTTGILDIVGGKEKLGALCGWSKKMALEKVQEHLRALIGQPVNIDEKWIDAVRKSAWKRDKDKLKEAGDIGTKIHASIDAYIAGTPPILDEQTEQGYNNFLSWIKDSGIKLIQGDTFVGHIGPCIDGGYPYAYGGALDALGEMDGKLVLLDWKTSNSMRDTYPLQAAAYATAFEEMYGQKIERGFVVRFGKEIVGDVEPKEVDLELSWAAFKNALELTRAMKSNLWRTK